MILLSPCPVGLVGGGRYYGYIQVNSISTLANQSDLQPSLQSGLESPELFFLFLRLNNLPHKDTSHTLSELLFFIGTIEKQIKHKVLSSSALLKQYSYDTNLECLRNH